MAQLQWIPDIPSGVMRNRSLSDGLRFQAVAQAKLVQFTTPEPGYGKKKGETLTIQRIGSLAVPSNPRITESDNIPESSLSITTKSVTVAEIGRQVPYSSLMQDLNSFDPKQAIQKQLKNQLKLSLDKMASEAFKNAKLRYSSTGVAGGDFNKSTNGSFNATAATHQLTVAHVQAIRDDLYTTYGAEPYDGDDYMCAASTVALRGIKDDPEWQDWQKYLGVVDALYRGEVGRIENIRFVEINNTSALGKEGTNNIGAAIFFGDDAVRMAVAVDPELRVAIPTDFGRKQSVAWYGVLEFTEVWDVSAPAFGQANIIYFGSA